MIFSFFTSINNLLFCSTFFMTFSILKIFCREISIFI